MHYRRPVGPTARGRLVTVGGLSLGAGPPIRRVSRPPDAGITGGWPANIPAVRAILDHGLDLGSVTVLVGENGSGKSTIVEANRRAAGHFAGGGVEPGTFQVRPRESALAQRLRLERSPGAARWAYFLRAETMHVLYAYLEELLAAVDVDLHEHSARGGVPRDPGTHVLGALLGGADKRGLLLDLGHPDRVLPGIEAVECGRRPIQLVTRNDHERAHPRILPLHAPQCSRSGWRAPACQELPADPGGSLTLSVVHVAEPIQAALS